MEELWQVLRKLGVGEPRTEDGRFFFHYMKGAVSLLLEVGYVSELPGMEDKLTSAWLLPYMAHSVIVDSYLTYLERIVRAACAQQGKPIQGNIIANLSTAEKELDNRFRIALSEYEGRLSDIKHQCQTRNINTHNYSLADDRYNKGWPFPIEPPEVGTRMLMTGPHVLEAAAILGESVTHLDAEITKHFPQLAL